MQHYESKKARDAANYLMTTDEYYKKTCVLANAFLKLATPIPADDWSEEDGDVLWWNFPVKETPFVGTPLCFGFDPNFHTHWTPLLVPEPKV